MTAVDLLVLLPIAAAIVAAFSGRHARVVALLGTLATATTLVTLSGSGVFGGAEVRGAIVLERFVPFWAMKLDGLSTPLVALTAFLSIVAVLASWNVKDRPAAHHALLIALEAAVMGVFLAEDIILFYVFWEAVLIPMYFLIGIWGHENRKHAAQKFFIYTFLGSALMLAGILVAVTSAQAQRIPDLVGANATFPATLVFWLLLAGMLVKVPVVPLHTWLPDAHVEAPTAGSIMLAGVLLKMGGYGLMRVAIPFAPSAYEASRTVLVALGIIGIVYGAAMALAQSDLKRLVAFSSVAHMGFVVLAIGSGTPAAYGAAMLGMVSHGVVAGLLFLLVGLLYERTHTREIDRFGGMGRLIPRWAAVLTFGALASLGLPGLSGFPGEFGAILEGYRAVGWWIAPATVGLVLSAAYNLRAVGSVNHGPVAEEWRGMNDLNPTEWIPVSILCVAILVLGVWPRAVLDISQVALKLLAPIVGGGV
ncbi:MAG: NADH-quinone oxidoreductase subunit M [Actinomycetota bacterium]|nr:NADH-quinone oxidoreductase subunit M [Actinomycetota bacterium]